MKLLTEDRRKQMMLQSTRDLFAAGWLGEQVFAHLGLHRAVDVVSDPRERTRVIGEAWNKERPVGALLLGGLVASAAVELAAAARRRDWLELAASICALGAVGASVGCAISGAAISGHGETPIATGFTPRHDTPRRARRAQRLLSVFAPIGIALGAASIGLSIAARKTE
jgi:hypothetical protein